MVWPLGHFLLKASFGKMGAKLSIFFKIVTIDVNFKRFFGRKFGLFYIFDDLAFLKLLMVKFGLTNFWNLPFKHFCV